MENGQAVAFLPMAVFCCVFIVLIIGFIVLVIFIIKKTKDSSWTGKIIDKKHTTSRDFDTDQEKDYFTLVVDLDGGGKKNLGVSQKLFDEFSIGNKIKKDKGELYPKKTN